MGDLFVRIENVKGELLDDLCDVRILDASSGSTLVDKRGISAKKTIKLADFSAGVRLVQAMPTRYRSVSRLVMVPEGGKVTVELPCPVDPKCVTHPVFPSYDALLPPLKAVPERSTLEHEILTFHQGMEPPYELVV